MRIKIKIGRY